MKSKKLTAMLLTAAMVFNLSLPLQAAPAGPESPENISYDTTLKELEQMTPGKDYDLKTAFTVVDSLEDAERAAKQFDAELIDYKYGIATLALKKDIREVMKDEEFSIDSDNEFTLYPQTRLHLYDAGGNRRSKPSTNDPKIGSQWFHEKINTGDAWNTAKGQGALVVVIDSGARGSHNDLKNNIQGNEEIVTNSQSGRDDDYGYWSVTSAGDTRRRPGGGGEGGNGENGGNNSGGAVNNDLSDGHGTHVSGLTVADEDNGCCGAGVAPDAGLYVIKVFPTTENEDDSECSFADVVSAINKAVELKAHVINMSLGVAEGGITSSEINAMQSAIDNAYNNGITVVTAAGNDGSSGKDYPGCLEHVINVGSINSSGSLSDFSNYGEYVSMCAPGESILSTVTKDDNAMENMDGTSMSSPIVAGVAALVYSANTELLNGHDSTAAQRVRNIMLSSTDNVEYKYENHIVTGCIDAAEAVARSARGDYSGPESLSANAYVFKEKGTGYLTSYSRNTTTPIAPGKTIKLQVCDTSGTPVQEAKKKKNVTWSVSNTSDFSIKNGKLKCKKTASPGADTYVYAEFGGNKVTARFAAVRETIVVGCYDQYGDFTSKVSIDGSVGSTVDVNNCDVLISGEVGAYYAKPSKASYDDYFDDYGSFIPWDPGWGWYGEKRAESEDSGYVSAQSAGYAIKLSNKNAGSISRDKNGNIISFVPTKKGTYTVTYTMIDGGNKKFKVKLHVQ